MLDERLKPIWWALRITFGVVPIVAGLDKFFDLLTRWEQYLNRLATRIIPLTPHHFMMAVGVVEIVAGAIVLSRFTRIGALIVSLWLAANAVNLLSTVHYLDVAVRDLVMSLSAYTLARLEAVRVDYRERVGERQGRLDPASARN
jgi:uncharacterized membrane protein YphA (DoxX/SURF4 family)